MSWVSRNMHNTLSVQSTPFIGRAEDLANIQRLLTDSSCRLLTMTGLGRSGKTRLAIQSADVVASHFQKREEIDPLFAIAGMAEEPVQESVIKSLLPQTYIASISVPADK